jgi:hypothetical protein
VNDEPIDVGDFELLREELEPTPALCGSFFPKSPAAPVRSGHRQRPYIRSE